MAAPQQTIRVELGPRSYSIEIGSGNLAELGRSLSEFGEVSHAVAAANYDEIMPIFNPTGRFDPKALDILARSFVEMGALPTVPDMKRLYTEDFLPKQ